MKKFGPILVLVGALLAGCAATQAPEKYFTLRARVPAPMGAAPPSAYRVKVAPISVPDLVDRAQLVLRVAPRQVILLEQSRWAEPLKSAIGRAVADNLGRLLPEARIERSGDDAEIRVRLEVWTFELRADREASIDLAWTVRAGTHELSGRAVEHEVANGPDIDALVAAQEEMLARIGHRIAADVRNLAARPAPG